MSLVDFVRSRPLLANASTILYYGGSFNPWHQGHESCVRLGSSIAPVVVIPDNNPQKQIGDQRTSLEEIENNIQAISDRAFIFSDFFHSADKTPTVEWVTQLKQQLPQIEHVLLLGHDSFIGLDSWIDFQRILQSIRGIYVVSRLDDIELQKLKEKKYLAIAPTLRIRYLGNHPHEHLSSTNIRSSNP